MNKELYWSANDIAAAKKYLNEVVIELFGRTQRPVEERNDFLGKIFVVEKPDVANVVFQNHDLYVKNFGLVASFGASRFTLNGATWAHFREKSQKHLAKAGRPAMIPEISKIYGEEIGFHDTLEIAELERSIGRAALRVFLKAFGIDIDVTPFLDIFQKLRAASAMLQYTSWSGTNTANQDPDMIVLLARQMCFDFWAICQQFPELEALIRSMSDGRTDQDLEDSVSDFMTNMFAGIETTTASLGWMIDCLSKGPEVQEKLRQDVLAAEGKTPDSVKVFRDEVMRFFPPIPFVVRELAEDATLGGQDLNKGDVVVVSIVALHRDPDTWSDPNAFHAARSEFVEGSPAVTRAFKPFLTGPRMCGGRRLATLEIDEALRILLTRYKFANSAKDTAFQYALAFCPLLNNSLQIRAISDASAD
jgi:cytochrome P450